MTTPTNEAALEALLARAVELEVKTAQVEAALAGQSLTIDAAEDLADQVREELDGELDAQVVADLEERLEAITDELEAAEEAGTLPGVDPVADWEAGSDDDDPKGMDFDEPGGVDLEGKALGCAQCGSTDVDELVTGAKQCGDCGWPTGEAKSLGGLGMDFDEPDDEPAAAAAVEVKTFAAGDGKTEHTLSELELLRARRVALED